MSRSLTPPPLSSGLVLHEEHIELLSEDFKALKREVEGKVLQEGTLHFTGRSAVGVSSLVLAPPTGRATFVLCSLKVAL